LLGNVVVTGQTDLLQVVDALGAAGRLARRLHGGKQESDQNCDDGDDDQEFDQRESTAILGLHDPSPFFPKSKASGHADIDEKAITHLRICDRWNSGNDTNDKKS
jgi:hypothetical protein